MLYKELELRIGDIVIYSPVNLKSSRVVKVLSEYNKNPNIKVNF